MSVSEFLAWDPADGQPWQLVDGEPQAMAPANRTHGAIQAELGGLIRNHLAERTSPCSVVIAPGIVPRAQSRSNVRIPDLAVTCSGYDAEEPTLPDPVLIVEILSLSNHAETWSNVWTYTTIPSVREILIVRTVTIGADSGRHLAGAARDDRGRRPYTRQHRFSRADRCVVPHHKAR
jgi:Uma2 family endonuclease